MGILGTVGIADKENYNPSETYVIGNSVYYEGSTWVARKNNLTGITPEEGENWKYLARGFGSDNLSQIEARDSLGLMGIPGTNVVSQDLIDAISMRVIAQLIPYTNIANNFLATDPKTVLSGPMGKALKDQLDTTNSNLSNKANASDLGFDQSEHRVGDYKGKALYAKTVFVTKSVNATWQNIYAVPGATLVLIDYGKSYVIGGGLVMLLESKEASGMITRCNMNNVEGYCFLEKNYEFALSILYTKD